jgi:hypothetical protein
MGPRTSLVRCLFLIDLYGLYFLNGQLLFFSPLFIPLRSLLLLLLHLHHLFFEDFINTQAIIARSLVLNLAYPQMQDALNELLIHDLEGSPEVEFITPEALGVVHKRVRRQTKPTNRLIMDSDQPYRLL